MYAISKELWQGEELYTIRNPETQFSLGVSANLGMNVFYIKRNNKDVLVFDEERYKDKVAYATPVLYPAANLARNGVFSFGGTECHVPRHGFARLSAFEVVDTFADEKKAYVTGVLKLVEGDENYKVFPWVSSLKVTILVENNNMLTWLYEVHNKDESPMAYSFGIHPYFVRKADTSVACNAAHYMQMDEGRLPTGKILPVEGTKFDLSVPKLADETALDDIFYPNKTPSQTVLTYPTDRYSILFETSKEFSHLVIFSPPKRNFICVENQTSAVDGFNLYAQGFKEESGLLIVNPNEKQSGYIRATFADL